MNPWRSASVSFSTAIIVGLLASPWMLTRLRAADTDKAVAEKHSKTTNRDSKNEAIQVYYLEIVTRDVDGVCATYAAATGAEFGAPVAGLGNARTAAMPGGGLVGVRAPLRDNEAPVVRPYWLVDDIKTAITAAENAGGTVAHPPMEIPGYGTFAIYLQGGNDHGLWQKSVR